MTEHERETDFLRHCLLYEDTAEHQDLEEKITQVQRDERCVRRAVWLMVFLASLATAGLCYSAVFRVNYPQNMDQFITPFIIRVLCALGLGSVICLLVFVVLGRIYRRRLDQSREEARRLARKLIASRLGNPSSRL